LGRNLYLYGFIEYKQDPSGTYKFVQGKVFKSQLEQLAEDVYSKLSTAQIFRQ